MNRKIKFKAWDRFDRQLVNDIIFERGTLTLNNFLDDVNYPEQLASYYNAVEESGEIKVEGAMENRFKLLQYTGLKDINGREIYEGDYDQDFNVVIWCAKRNGWAMAVYDFPSKEFIDCHCYECEGNFELDDVIKTTVIKGNIYEYVEPVKNKERKTD